MDHFALPIYRSINAGPVGSTSPPGPSKPCFADPTLAPPEMGISSVDKTSSATPIFVLKKMVIYRMGPPR